MMRSNFKPIKHNKINNVLFFYWRGPFFFVCLFVCLLCSLVIPSFILSLYIKTFRETLVLFLFLLVLLSLLLWFRFRCLLFVAESWVYTDMFVVLENSSIVRACCFFRVGKHTERSVFPSYLSIAWYLRVLPFFFTCTPRNSVDERTWNFFLFVPYTVPYWDCASWMESSTYI